MADFQLFVLRDLADPFTTVTEIISIPGLFVLKNWQISPFDFNYFFCHGKHRIDGGRYLVGQFRMLGQRTQ
jgi:hypothetical protein